jgi:hypothetical protein
MIKNVYSRIISTFLKFCSISDGWLKIEVICSIEVMHLHICDKLGETTKICRSAGWHCSWTSQIQRSSGAGMLMSYCTFFSCSRPYESPLQVAAFDHPFALICTKQLEILWTYFHEISYCRTSTTTCQPLQSHYFTDHFTWKRTCAFAHF